MEVHCPHCGAKGEVPGPGMYLCPHCKTPVSVSDAGRPSAQPPLFSSLQKKAWDPAALFWILLAGGLLHLLVSFLLALSFGVVMFGGMFVWIVVPCTWWGMYLPYQLLQRTGKIFDVNILAASVIGALGMLIVGMFFQRVFELLGDRGISYQAMYGKDWLASPWMWMWRLFLIGMYLGSVIGYFARLAQWAAQSRTENPTSQ